MFQPAQLGALVDVRASTGGWWLAQVVDVRDVAARTAGKAAEIRVHYQGWGEEFDEWVPVPDAAVLAAILQPPAARPLALRTAAGAARVAPAVTRSSHVVASCSACHNRRAGDLLFCDAAACGRAYHAQCLKPALATIPAGAWYCPLHTKAALAAAAAAAAAASDGAPVTGVKRGRPLGSKNKVKVAGAAPAKGKQAGKASGKGKAAGSGKVAAGSGSGVRSHKAKVKASATKGDPPRKPRSATAAAAAAADVRPRGRPRKGA